MELKQVGRIVEEATPEGFFFVASKEGYPPKHECVVVKSVESTGSVEREVLVLCQVTGLASRSSAYSSKLELDALERVYAAGVDDTNVLCTARVLGFLAEEDGRKVVLMPRRAVFPGNPVYLAPDWLVEEFFSYPEGEGVFIGHLATRPSVKVHFSVNSFRRHVAVIAQTGAGKSYTVGVVLEELMKLGATVVVIDPHADYVFLSRRRDMLRHKYSDRVQVFKNPNSSGRYSEDQLDNVHGLYFKFSELEPDEIADIAGIPEQWTNVRGAVRKAVNKLKKNGKSYGLKELLSQLEGSEDKGGAREAQHYARAHNHLRRLVKLQVFGDYTTPVSEEILKRGCVSVLDLSGLNDASQDYITSRVLSEVFRLRQTGEFPYPVFVIVEEAHRFAPHSKERRSRSSEVLRMIAAEGRKFGVFLIVVTQRPSRINPDILSQCNSQVILRITNPQDQRAVAEASERLGEELMRDLPGLNVGEAVIVGELTRVPVVVRVRKRITREGGADIDLVEELRKVREELSMSRSRPTTGVFSEV